MQKTTKSIYLNYSFRNYIKPLLTLIMFLLFLSGCKTITKSNSIKYNEAQKVILKEPSYKLGLLSGISVDKDDNIYILNRAGRDFNAGLREPVHIPVILKYNKEEKLIDSFGAGMFSLPHMITIDNEDNLWVTDVVLQQIVKLNSKGKLLYSLGEKYKSGNDSSHFNQPTDIAFLKDNSFYISDGYKNARIVKYSADGKFIKTWGVKGDKIGEFNLPHSIAVTDNKIYVADRENSRIQIFDINFNFISELNLKEVTGKPLALTIDRKGNIIVTGFKATVLLTPKLKEIRTWPVSGHDIVINSKGIVYLVGLDGLIRITSNYET